MALLEALRWDCCHLRKRSSLGCKRAGKFSSLLLHQLLPNPYNRVYITTCRRGTVFLCIVIWSRLCQTGKSSNDNDERITRMILSISCQSNYQNGGRLGKRKTGENSAKSNKVHTPNLARAATWTFGGVDRTAGRILALSIII